MPAVLDDAWIEAAVEASDHRSGPSGVVAIAIGKTTPAVLDIVEGRVVGAGAADEAGVTIPLTAAQLEAIVTGAESLAQAFMRGDVKPEGATGPLLAAIELFEDDRFRTRLAELTGASAGLA